VRSHGVRGREGGGRAGRAGTAAVVPAPGDDEGPVAVGPLEAVGYTTVASVVGARVGRLQVIDGVGPDTAAQVVAAACALCRALGMPSTVAAAVASPWARRSTLRAAGPHRTRARVLRPSSGPVPGIVFVPPATPCLPGPRRAQPRRPCVTWTTTQRGVDQPRASPRRVRCRRPPGPAAGRGDHRLERCRQRALEPCLRRRLRRRCRPDRLPGRTPIGSAVLGSAA
jgi:hypothetical protein